MDAAEYANIAALEAEHWYYSGKRRLVREWIQRARPVARKRTHPALDAWEERMRGRFATQIRIVGGLARGRVEIHYFSHEDLERILELAGVGSKL